MVSPQELAQPQGKHWAPERVDVSARDGRYAAVIDAVPLPGPAGEGELDHELASLRAGAARAGVGVEIEPGRAGTRFAWHAS